MKWFIVTTLLIATIAQINASKNIEKTSRPIKKANSVKPTKYPKSILDEFSGLTDDDTKFIKELDKQFKVHGEKIKIKVEKENTTMTKNSKRTIDGSLGYGYHHQQQHLQQQGYYFAPPKFMVYPYSQQDIFPTRLPANQPQGGFIPNHGPLRFAGPQSNRHTSIRDDEQQSNRFSDYRGPQLFPQQQNQGQPVPVIVLRIPGPPKYASHLQALLQRYLEIRASQYINELQQQEQQNLHISATPQPQQFSGPRYLPTPAPQQQRVIPVQQTPIGYATPGSAGPIAQQPHGYSTTEATYTDVNVGVYPSQAIYEDHQIVSPQPVENQHQIQQIQQIQQLQHFRQVQNIQNQQREQYIQQIQQQQQQQQLHAQQLQFQQQQQQQQEEENDVVLSPHQQEQLRLQQQAAYEQSFPRDQPEDEEDEEPEEPQQQITYDRQPQLQPHQVDLQNQPPINENYPSHLHTQVILPQQRIPPRQYHQEVFHPQQQQQIVHESTPGPYNYQAPEEDHQLQYTAQVNITPKPPRIPYNYHAHPIPAIPERRRDAPYSQDKFRKYTNVINRLKKPIVVPDE